MPEAACNEYISLLLVQLTGQGPGDVNPSRVNPCIGIEFTLSAHAAPLTTPFETPKLPPVEGLFRGPSLRPA